MEGIETKGKMVVSERNRLMERGEFLKREYTALKSEMVERIRIVNSQASNAIATILTTWSMAIAFTVVCYSEEVLQEYISRFVLKNIKISFI